MQPSIKPFGPHSHRVLLRPLPRPQFTPVRNGSEGPGLEREDLERTTNSKLDRLAEELRALGIRF